jgi:two-component system capsular synthesis sensor histidine kinase RcsC
MQILQNLMSNAAKFTQHGSITLSTRLLRHEIDRTWVRIEVADTGIGIPSALQAMVFKPLTQADASVTRRFGGTGLGLFLCRSLAELMGGRALLQSEPNVGSIFSIEIPLQASETTADVATSILPGVSVKVATANPRLKQIWTDRLAGWGATIFPSAGLAVPDICLADGVEVQPPGGASRNEQPIRGTINAMPLGPFTPARNEHGLTVSLYSSEALLAALLDLSDRRSTISSTSTATRDKSIRQLDILIAEDDPISRLLIEHQLHALGYTSVRSAGDGREALNMWTEREADAVITDIGMPYLDGVGLLNEIRRRRPNAFVIAATAAGASDISPETAAGFSHVLHKPVLLVDLRCVLKMVCAARSAATEDPHESENGKHLSPDRLEAALREAFFESWPGEYDSIKQALTNRDGERSRRRLHRLQGGLLAIGLDARAEDCLALQALCVEGKWEDAEVRFDRVVAFLDQIGSQT